MKKILFVDDEPSILQGLKRMLRSQRDEWDMYFAEGGAAALQILAKEPFDAVISDMRMPGMDGAQLLAEVKKLYPESIRFVLSGYSEHELVMRSVGPSHQYLAKPCDPDVLKSALTGAFALHSLLASDTLRTLVAGMTSLPSLPVIYNAVVETIQNENSGINDVGKLIEQDPGMSVKILQLVNSAYFGLGRQITSPVEAANFLGLDTLKGLVLSEGVFSQFDAEVVKTLSLDQIRNDSIFAGTLARKIAQAETKDKILIDQAYLGGLLHDIGTLTLAANCTEDYLKARELMKSDNISLSAAERKIFGTTHAEVGAYMLGLWGLDDSVVAAVAYHHKPAEFAGSTQFSSLTAVYIASTAVETRKSKDPLPLTECLDINYLKTLGLEAKIESWQAMCSDIDEDAA